MHRKDNADRRHHVPKMLFKVQNWPAYKAGLRRRGSLTLMGLTISAPDHSTVSRRAETLPVLDARMQRALSDAVAAQLVGTIIRG
jgi:hypothetical protein